MVFRQRASTPFTPNSWNWLRINLEALSKVVFKFKTDLKKMKEWQRYISVENIAHLSFIKFVSQANNKPYSMMASLSAMSPSTMRWMMLLCSSSDRFLWDTSGVLYLVAGDGSTPWSHAWLSISSSDARLFGSLWSIRFIRLWRTEREDDEEDVHQKFLEREL